MASAVQTPPVFPSAVSGVCGVGADTGDPSAGFAKMGIVGTVMFGKC